MEFRYLGNSGLKISEITYGNWLTHGSQVENDAATAVRARGARRRHHHLRHRRRLRQHQGRDGARRGAEGRAARVRWRSSPRSTGRPAPAGTNDTGLSRKHIMESIDGSLQPAADRLRRPLPGAPLRLRDAARGDDAGVRRRRPRRARRSTSASASGPPSRSAPAHALAAGARHPADLATSRSTRCCGGSSRPRSCRPARSSASRQIVWSPDRAGRADRQVPARASRRRRARGPPTRRAAPT